MKPKEYFNSLSAFVHIFIINFPPNTQMFLQNCTNTKPDWCCSSCGLRNAECDRRCPKCHQRKPVFSFSEIMRGNLLSQIIDNQVSYESDPNPMPMSPLLLGKNQSSSSSSVSAIQSNTCSNTNTNNNNHQNTFDMYTNRTQKNKKRHALSTDAKHQSWASNDNWSLSSTASPSGSSSSAAFHHPSHLPLHSHSNQHYAHHSHNHNHNHLHLHSNHEYSYSMPSVLHINDSRVVDDGNISDSEGVNCNKYHGYLQFPTADKVCFMHLFFVF